LRAAVLIDISSQPQEDGIGEVRAFMGNARDGFASLDEAADTVAAFMPQRPRPPNPQGLARNFRLRGGRYYWHWDPDFFGQMVGQTAHVQPPPSRSLLF
jgi:hypothetical protein